MSRRVGYVPELSVRVDALVARLHRVDGFLYLFLRFLLSFLLLFLLATPIYNYFNTPGSAVHTALNPVNIVATRATLFAYYKELYEHLGLYEEYKPQIYKYLVAVAEA